MIRELIRKSNDKAKLKACFRAAELTRTKTVNNNKYEMIPQIHSINYDKPEYTEVVFTLPNGVNPKNIEKNDYVFKQYFGERIEITGHLKKFVLKIYKKPLSKEVKYNFERFYNHAKNEKYKLPILCGDDTTNGNLIMFDMITRPHIMNCGETGGGKSTWLRSVITFLIQFLPPEKLDLYLCDLGVVEFALFRHIKHVKVPIATSVNKTIKIFGELESEIKKRKKLMIKHEVTHVDDLPMSIPYKVCVVDEFHNLKGKDDAMDRLMHIGAEGRKLGIFLILTTQRPSKDIINGDIKANLTVSMAFRVKNKMNSNMILDVGAPNAAKLRGNGHGIVSLDEYYEIQTANLGEKQARKILAKYKDIPNENDITDLVEIDEDIDEEEDDDKPIDIQDKLKKLDEEAPFK